MLVVLVLIIPMFLNFVLLAKNPFQVAIVSAQNPQAYTWLMFWGAYLSAVGSVIMAYVSYRQNQKILEKTHEIETNKKKLEAYRIMEDYIVKNERLHSDAYFQKYKLIDVSNRNNLLYQLKKHRDILLNISTRVVFFRDSTETLDKSSDYYRYFHVLAELNDFELKHLTKFIDDIENSESRIDSKTIQDFVEKVNHEVKYKYEKLADFGFELLKSYRNNNKTAFVDFMNITK